MYMDKLGTICVRSSCPSMIEVNLLGLGLGLGLVRVREGKE